MPKQYLAIKEKLLKEGKSTKEAEKHAAMIYNATPAGQKNPVGRGSK